MGVKDVLGTTSSSHEDDAVLTADALVNRYGAVVLGVCLAHTPSVHDAEDVAQSVLLQAIAKLATLRDPSRARGWLVQIARRMCVDHHRRYRPTRPLPDDATTHRETWQADVEHLHAALAQLPDHYRETITLYYLQERSSAAVAEALGIGQHAVRQRLVRGRLMLHKLLSEETP